MSTHIDSSVIAAATSTASSAAGTSASAAPSTGAQARSAGAQSLSWIDRLTLGAIGLVVVLVTLPVLRGFGLRENERDAVRTLRVLSAEPAAKSRDDLARRPFVLADLVAGSDHLTRRLEDLEGLADGRLRRHGYLFDVARLATGEPLLIAWPWEHGQTGRGAFAWSARLGLLGHGNGDGRFSGASSPPLGEDLSGGDWVVMPRR